jgi:hypothetical protein
LLSFVSLRWQRVQSLRLFPAVSNKAEILRKLEERPGPEARKLFEKFTKDMQKLQARQEQDAGHARSP